MKRPYTPPAPDATHLTLPQAMARLGCSRSTVWKMIRDGRLHPVKIGPRSNRFARAEVEAILRGERQAGFKAPSV